MSTVGPQLRADLTIVEQVFRGEQSFVVKDPTTHAYFRFRATEIAVMRLCDGTRTAAAIAAAMAEQGVRVSVNTVDGFARRLSKLGLLEKTLVERSTQQLERLRAERRRQRSLIRGELFRLRFSFGDPDRLLSRTYPAVRWCFTPAFVVLSLLTFAAYVAIVTSQRTAFAQEVGAAFAFGALTPWSIAILILTFTLLTAIHELGHAYACKHFGGEVHEMGFMLLFFIPAFYANVNDAWSFPERRARLWVTAAGGWIELFVTALLAIIWVIIQPGSVLGDIAIAAMLVGGIANILTNANPLMPLDGYFALGDWLEIPNLRHRAKEYVTLWSRRYVLRDEVLLPEVDGRERRILLWYGVAAAAYSTGFLVLLATRLVAWTDRTIGALVAGLLVLALLYATRAWWSNVVRALGLRRGVGGSTHRWRRGGLAVVALAIVIAAVIPVGLTARGDFTVLPVTQQVIAAPAAGVIARVAVREGDAVAAGAPVVQLADFALARERVQRERDRDSLTASVRRSRAAQQIGEAASLAAEAEGADAFVTVANVRTEALRVRAPVPGVVTTPRPEQMTGRHVQFGDTLLVISALDQLEAVLVLRGAGAARVQVGDAVSLMAYQDVAHSLKGTVSSVSPIAGGEVPGVEARVRLPAPTTWRAGATGEARVTWRRATLLSAVIWALRARVRADLLL